MKNSTDCDCCNFPNASPSCLPSNCPQEGAKMSRKEKAHHMELCPTCSSSAYRFDSCFDIVDVGRVQVLSGDPHILPVKVKDFIAEMVSVLRPTAIFICTGTVFEEASIRSMLSREGRLSPLTAFPGVVVANSDPSDTESLDCRAFLVGDGTIKTSSTGMNGVTTRARDELCSSLSSSMRGRTLFVVPFSIGPIGSRRSLNAVQLTDCPFNVLATRILSRVSPAVWDAIGTGDFIQCIHTVGCPRPVFDQSSYNWPCNRTGAFSVINTRRRRIISYGTAHFASAPCRNPAALRLASDIGRHEGWMAEPAAIISITDPAGDEIFACVQGTVGTGKHTIAFLESTLPGWKIRPLSSSMAWLRWSKEGRLMASSPENGFLLQWSYNEKMEESQPVSARAIRKNSLLLNVAATSEGQLDWYGRATNRDKKRTEEPRAKSAAVVAATDIDTLHPLWDSPHGVPISAYIFLSNRPTVVPVLVESPGWKEGIALGLVTRTLKGNGIEEEVLEHNPLGISAYLTCSLSQYVNQWMEMEKEGRQMPKIFHMNLFRQGVPPATVAVTPRDSHSSRSSGAEFDRALTPDGWTPTRREGRTCWPGFGDNVRLLAWIHGRVRGKEEENGVKILTGTVPKTVAREGMKVVDWEECSFFDANGWRTELRAARAFFKMEKLSPSDTAFLEGYISRLRAEVVKLTPNAPPTDEPIGPNSDSNKKLFPAKVDSKE